VNKTTSNILFFLTCLIIAVNAVRSITNSYSVASVFTERKLQTERQYLELVKKKNELDYINSPFFVEKQLRESLNYYRRGEKLLVFTKQIQDSGTGETTTIAINPYSEWAEFLKGGVKNPFNQ
jgi:hypothetical protein